MNWGDYFVGVVVGLGLAFGFVAYLDMRRAQDRARKDITTVINIDASGVDEARIKDMLNRGIL